MDDNLAVIQFWQIPAWHSDWGDPKLEIELLKKATRIVHSMNPDFSYQLDPFEEGVCPSCNNK